MYSLVVIRDREIDRTTNDLGNLFTRQNTAFVPAVQYDRDSVAEVQFCQELFLLTRELQGRSLRRRNEKDALGLAHQSIKF